MNKILFKALTFFIILVVAIDLLFTFSPRNALPNSAYSARIQSNLDQMMVVSKIYYKNKGTYIGFDKDVDYLTLSKNIKNTSKEIGTENSYAFQTSEKTFCARIEMSNYLRNINIYCIDSKSGIGITTTDQYCTAEKPYCAE